MLPIEVTSSLTAVLLVMEYIQEVEIECQSPLMGVIRYVKNNCFNFWKVSFNLKTKYNFVNLYIINEFIF